MQMVLWLRRALELDDSRELPVHFTFLQHLRNGPIAWLEEYCVDVLVIHLAMEP